MLQPPEWRIETTEGFERKCASLSPDASRLDQHRSGWKFYLERRPFRFSHGLTNPDDELRVLVAPDQFDGVEYVVGVHVDRSARTVWLAWLERRELTR